MKKNLSQRLFSFLSIVALFVQVLLPLTQVTQAYAQEATPTITDTPTVTPTDSITPTDTSTPTDTITPTVTPDDSVTPTVTPTDTLTPTDTSTPSPTDESTPTPDTNTSTPTSTNTDGSNNSQAPPDTVAPTTTPTVTPDNQTSGQQGQLSATVLDTASLPSLDLTSSQTNSATLSTDKADYAPTGTAIITGVTRIPLSVQTSAGV